jgi:hypothetical protein
VRRRMRYSSNNDPVSSVRRRSEVAGWQLDRPGVSTAARRPGCFQVFNAIVMKRMAVNVRIALVFN